MPEKSGGSKRAAQVKLSASMRMTLDLAAVGMPRLKCWCRRAEVMGWAGLVGLTWSISVMKAVVSGVVRKERERRLMNFST